MSIQQKKYKKGWRNNYRPTMPWSEVILKDLRFAWQDLVAVITKGKRPVIVAYPDFPSKKTTLHKIAASLGYRLTNKIVKDPKAILYFEDITHGSSEDLKRFYPDKFIINKECTDISKRAVDKVHLDVFGYNTFIDPSSYQGKAVAKSDTNALHDGRIIDCPAPRTEGVVYQVLIDNVFDNDFVMDHRVAIVGDRIVNAYKKFKKHAVRFTNEVTRSERHEPASLFSKEELEKILLFSQKMGASFCELDILRNNTDQKIYIIDVNKTPYGPPSGLPEREAALSVELLSNVFKDQFLKD